MKRDIVPVRTNMNRNMGIVTVVVILLTTMAVGAADEIEMLVKTVKPPVRFKDYKPQFEIKEFPTGYWWYEGVHDEKGKKIGVKIVERKGSQNVILDNGRWIGKTNIKGGGYGGTKGPSIEMWCFQPGHDVTDFVSDPLNGEQTSQVGCNTGIGYPKGLPKPDEADYRVTAGEELCLNATLRWIPEKNNKKLAATVKLMVTIRVDPILGYVLDQSAEWESSRPIKDKKSGDVVFSSCLFPRGLQNPWPGGYGFEGMVSSPHAQGWGADSEKRYLWWYTSGSMIESIRHRSIRLGKADRFRDGHYNVRPGGFYGYLKYRNDPESFGYVETVPANARYIACATCPAYGEVFNHAHLEPAQGDGKRHRGRMKRRAVGVPPEIADHIMKTGRIPETATKYRKIQIRLSGEDFEDQPQPLQNNRRGVCLQYGEISDERAHSGKKSLLIPGRPADKLRYNTKEEPPFRFRRERRYRMSYWVYVEGKDTEAFAATYYDGMAPAGQKVKSPFYGEGMIDPVGRWRAPPAYATGKWQFIEQEFQSPKTGQGIHMNFCVIGPGRAFFDDYKLEEILE